MRLVIVESPFAAPTPEGIEENIRYARACVRDSLERGEAPIASHLLYTQDGILRDDVPEERKWGIDAGLAWRRSLLHVYGAAVVYVDRGVSVGMKYGIEAHYKAGVEIEFRSLSRNTGGQLNAQDLVEMGQPADVVELVVRVHFADDLHGELLDITSSRIDDETLDELLKGLIREAKIEDPAVIGHDGVQARIAALLDANVDPDKILLYAKCAAGVHD